MEASDLSANPGLALERVLEQPSCGPRDVVLLTHPRNLMETDVAAAARRATPDTRLLALALDGRGTATLSELRHGVPVALRQFRGGFQQGNSTGDSAHCSSPGRRRGKVEPIGFPFRFGTGAPLAGNLFDFDHEGNWLLTASRDGMLHIWKLDGSGQVELLPCARWKDDYLAKSKRFLGWRAALWWPVGIRNAWSLLITTWRAELVLAMCSAKPLGVGYYPIRRNTTLCWLGRLWTINSIMLSI